MKRRCGAPLLGLFVLAVTACNLDNPGVSPPAGRLAYPVALALSNEGTDEAPRFLYVANSNFDIRYNAGSVHSYDLNELERTIRERDCLGFGVPDAGVSADAGTIIIPIDNGPDAGVSMDGGAGVDGGVGADAGAGVDGGLLTDGGAGVDGGLGLDGGVSGIEIPAGYEAASAYGTPRGVLCDGLDPEGYEVCCFDDATPFLKSEVLVDSYATGIGLRPDGKRVYVPLRSRNRLVYLDVADGALSCGDDEGRCTRGPDRKSSDDAPYAKFAPQPSALIVGSLADVVGDDAPSGYETDGTYVATVHDSGELSFFLERPGAAPKLEDVRGGGANRATSIAFDPLNSLFYVTASTSNVVDRVAVRIADTSVDGEQGPRELLERSSPIILTGFPGQASTDLRDIAVDPNDPTLVYALIRGTSPSFQQSVAFLRVDSTTNLEARLIGATRVGAGPSKLTLARMGPKQLLFVSSYDARSIFVIDTRTRELTSIIRGLSGPFDTVVDEARKLIYVADFRASVIRVIDAQGLVDRRLPPPRIVATLGSARYAEGF